MPRGQVRETMLCDRVRFENGAQDKKRRKAAKREKAYGLKPIDLFRLSRSSKTFSSALLVGSGKISSRFPHTISLRTNFEAEAINSCLFDSVQPSDNRRRPAF
jgi:hypothetical protein